MKHTPGPWKAFKETDYAPAQVHTEDEYYLCDVYGESYDARNANANLIAAAPELLETLRLYLSTYADTQTHPTASQEAACISSARAAVAKAEGRST